MNLPPTKTLDLGGGVKLELVLIPAGKFVMGTPEPVPVDEEGFRKQIVAGQAALAAGGGLLLVVLGVVLMRAFRQRSRPQLSLACLLVMTIAAGIALLGGLHWRHSAQSLEKAKIEYQAASARHDLAAMAKNEKPAHPVILTKPFYMGKYPVTQEQYQQVIGSNPSHFFTNKENPVEQVSWDDAQAFCKKLSGMTKQSARLPTEAEWEFACRAGTITTYHSGDTEADLARVASAGKGTRPVGQMEPNAFGLYDMHGLVYQWCQDWFGDDYYSKSPAEDPQGPERGIGYRVQRIESTWRTRVVTEDRGRVLRGGSWYIFQRKCRSALRIWRDPGDRVYYIGFRVVVATASTTP